MNKKRIRQMDLALRRRLADRPAADCFAGHDELLRRIETEGYMQRFAPLFNGARLRCADVLALCREELDALCGGAPQEGYALMTGEGEAIWNAGSGVYRVTLNGDIAEQLKELCK